MDAKVDSACLHVLCWYADSRIHCRVLFPKMGSSRVVLLGFTDSFDGFIMSDMKKRLSSYKNFFPLQLPPASQGTWGCLLLGVLLIEPSVCSAKQSSVPRRQLRILRPPYC